jgi:putative hydrolase of the HAD superfamily
MAGHALTVRFAAVVFDLYGTLVPEFPRSEFYLTVDRMALELGADGEAFREAWNRTAIGRQTGAYPTMSDNVREICEELGLDEPTELELERALAPRAAMYARWFHPRDGALETLAEVRSRGLPLGLISMCAPDTPAMWRASGLAGSVDVEVFSSETGLRKPDPAIYRYACERLGVKPSSCLFCGDGAYGELTGAEAVGMTAVEIRDPAIDVREQLRPEGEDWTGARVADLREILVML